MGIGRIRNGINESLHIIQIDGLLFAVCTSPIIVSYLKTLAEIEAEFERLGPMVFGFHDGQCEAPKIHAMRVSLVS